MTKDRENSHGWHGIYLKTTFDFDFFFFSKDRLLFLYKE